MYQLHLMRILFFEFEPKIVECKSMLISRNKKYNEFIHESHTISLMSEYFTEKIVHCVYLIL